MDPKVDAAPIRSYFTNIKSCEVLDPYTVRFIATERYFKTLGSARHLHRHPAEARLRQGRPRFQQERFGRHPIGTGPYKFVRWDTGSQIVVERNDDYWDTAHPRYPKRIVYQIIEEPYVAAQLLKKGEIDVFDARRPDPMGARAEDQAARCSTSSEIVYPFPAYTYLGFNLRLPIFSDIRVRHAIDLLIPRDEILAKVYLNQYANEDLGLRSAFVAQLQPRRPAHAL